MKITFKNVGQGDSIFLEWSKEGILHYGIIDCNIYEDNNPILDQIIVKKIEYIDFIILTHLHYDHYSGFSDLLEYCINNNVKIGKFSHTFHTEYFRILSSTILTQKQLLATERFLQTVFNVKKLIGEIENITVGLAPINLFDHTFLSFLSPNGKDYLDFSEIQAKYVNKKSTTAPDFNNLSTIILISNLDEGVLFTSDSTKKAFKRIINKIQSVVMLAQVPHHGSIVNLFPDFWKRLKRKENCPAIFSVGDVKKDKLPNVEVVQFYENERFYNESTNFVYGIKEFYNTEDSSKSTSDTVSSTLSYFSVLKSSTLPVSTPPIRFFGDKLYEVL